MKQDPFYKQIIDGLSGEMDPDTFERCAAEILRDDFPTLVPVRGGTDSGMDGAVADAKGEPFPLICTTGKDVIGNLTKNLGTYLATGGPRRKMILATTQQLSATRRSNLNKRAREKGCRLIQVYDQAAIADRLYRRPEWCRELLGINGTPPALSLIPLITRSLVGSDMIGRDQDLAWLESIDGDAVLTGQPGSGKTFLLYCLARKEKARFLVSGDRTEIASALRSQEPPIIIVDDAHLRLEWIASLQQIRRETGINFYILASCWPGQHESVQQALNVPDKRVRELTLLTRDEMVKVVKAAGVYGPDDLISDIVSQAEGRPGLAVTLTHLCLQGGVLDVALGTALSRSIRKSFEPIVGKDATDVLAAFAVGGDPGASMKAVSDFLGLPLAQVRRIVTELAAGGVIIEAGNEGLSVRPAPLRHALIRDTFFAGAQSLPIEQILGNVASLTAAVREMIGVRYRRGQIPQGMLEALLDTLDDPKLWNEYSYLGEEEVEYVLESHPEYAGIVVDAGLHFVPEKIIPMLLEKSVGDNRPLNTATDHPLRKIGDWIKEAEPGTGIALKQRQILAKAVSKWIAEGGDAAVASRGVAHAISPVYESLRSDPGSGDMLTIRRGLLTLDEMRNFSGIWNTCLNPLKSAATSLDWQVILDAIKLWVYPRNYSSNPLPNEVQEAMHENAHQMILDIAPLLATRQGMLAELSIMAAAVDVTVEIDQDQDFLTLFPPNDPVDWRAAKKEQEAAVEKLADQWVHDTPADTVQKIIDFEKQASDANMTWPRHTYHLCTRLASQTDAPLKYIVAFENVDSNFELAIPFLERAIAGHTLGWKETLHRLLDHPGLQGPSTSIILHTHDVPPELLNATLDRLHAGYARIVMDQCAYIGVPEGTASRLLDHSDIHIVTATVLGLWMHEPQGEIPADLFGKWRRAVATIEDEGYWLGKILKTDTALAVDWLLKWFETTGQRAYRIPEWASDLCTIFSFEERVRLIEAVPAKEYWASDMVSALVGGSTDVYRALLARKDLSDRQHLAPLGSNDGEHWALFAPLALDAGYTPENVAGAMIVREMSWMGEQSAMWQSMADWFTAQEKHQDERVARCAAVGKKYAESSRDRSLVEERKRAVRGW